MIQSMTGFGSREQEVLPYGKICAELRSSNHKFLEILAHLPEGFLSLEDGIKRTIESRIKRGRLTCVVNIVGGRTPEVFINKPLLKNYVKKLNEVKRQFQIKDEISINTLIQLPGALSLEGQRVSKVSLWPRIKVLIERSLDDLVKARQKEGRALHGFLRHRAEILKAGLAFIKTRYKKAIKKKASLLTSNEERSAFLKAADISEEIERLAFHIRNFRNKLSKNGPVGKELDFIAQELQREANTLAAKSCDTAISGRVVQMKSQIEKIREQVQNIE